MSQTSESETQTAVNNQDLVTDLDRRAPFFKFSTDWVLLAAILSATTWLYLAVLFDWEVSPGWLYHLAYWLGPFLAGAAIGNLSNHRRALMSRQYTRALDERAERPEGVTDEDWRQALNKVFNRNAQPRTWLVILGMLVWLGGAVVSFNYAFDALQFDYRSPLSWGEILVRIGGFVAGILVVGLLPASMVMSSLSYQRNIHFDRLLLATFSRDQLDDIDEADRNDFDIVDHDIDLQTMLRRVDTYTLESTLLGALAFSAFITIQFQPDQGAADSFSLFNHWWSEIQWITVHLAAFDLRASFPWPGNLDKVVLDHIGPLIALCLLISSVALLAVLTARIQFTDAFRHAEGEVAKAKRLNEKEEELLKDNPVDGDRRALRAALCTRQISQFLENAKLAKERVDPIVQFMRVFRMIGLWAFLSAAAICGVYFNPWAPLAIAMVFAMAFLFFVLHQFLAVGYVQKVLQGQIFRIGGGHAADGHSPLSGPTA